MIGEAVTRFFEDFVYGLVRNRFMIDLVEGDEFIGEKTQCPASAPVGRLAGGESEEMRFILAVKFAFVVSVRVAAMNRRDPIFGKSFAHALDCGNATVKRVADVFISPVFVHL